MDSSSEEGESGRQVVSILVKCKTFERCSGVDLSPPHLDWSSYKLGYSL